MIRCTYRLAASRKIISSAKCDHLPHKGDLIKLNQSNYIVDSVAQEGLVASISVHLQHSLAMQMSKKN